MTDQRPSAAEALRDAALRLADEAARAVTEPRRFHENEDDRQQQLGSLVALVRHLSATLDATRPAELDWDQRVLWAAANDVLTIWHQRAWVTLEVAMDRLSDAVKKTATRTESSG